MANYCVTGALGGGKSIVCVGIIKKALEDKKKVATNLDLHLENMVHQDAKKVRALRTPDVPNYESLMQLGLGYDGDFKGDSFNGVLVLDECAKWLNSRDFSNKSRKGLVDFFIHSRKRRWDVYFIIQHVDALDKQFRDLFVEHMVYCSRSDRHKIPFISPVYKFFTGSRLPMPRVHIANVFYCIGGKETHIENWVYRGNDLFNAYNTEQIFDEHEGQTGVSTYLSPYYTKGRYTTQLQRFKEACKAFKVSHFFLIGLLLGGFAAQAFVSDGSEPSRGALICNSDWKELFGDCSLSKKEVQEIIANHKGQSSSVEADADLSVEGKTFDDLPHVLDRVRIHASVLISGSYEYYFSNNGQDYKPELNGYTIYQNNECSAYLVNSIKKLSA